MRSSAIPALLATAALVATPACQLNERVTGTIAGAAGGMLVGGLLGSAVGSTPAGIILGGIAGGAAGYIWGDWVADQRERACAPSAAPAPCAAPSYGSPYGGYSYAPAAPAVAPAVAGTRGSVAQDRGAARDAFEAGRRATLPSVALAQYDRSIRLDPTRPEPHNAKGLVYLFQGKKAEADASFRAALAVDPAYAPALANRAKLAGS
jgi:hypothetical protein